MAELGVLLEDNQAANEVFMLPYAFAKRHGVLIEQEAEGNILLYRDTLKPTVLMEVQRNCSRIQAMRQVDAASFERLLAACYDRSQTGAAMMQELGDEADLYDIAETMPEPEDLLEAEDDAPIIRLINAYSRKR